MNKTLQLLYKNANELNKLKPASFNYDITHKLKTPLTLILNAAEAIVNSKKLTYKEIKHVETIRRNAERLSHLANRLTEPGILENDETEWFVPKTVDPVDETRRLKPKTNRHTTHLPHDIHKTGGSILVIENDIELNNILVTELSKNFNVKGVYNGKEGLKFAKKHSPDLVITETTIPEMDGITLCRRLRNDPNTSHIPVIFISGKTRWEEEIEGLEIGAVDYIRKPFNLLTLNLKIRNILINQSKIEEKFRTNKLMEPKNEKLISYNEKFLKDAVNAVDKNIDNPYFDVKRFGYEMGISSNQVYRRLKSLTGQTAIEFIRNQRLKSSANLLLQNKRNISEVIYLVGFSSPSYFTRCFKSYFGCTPKEYVEHNGNKDTINTNDTVTE